MRPENKQAHNPFMGIVFMILGTLFFTFSDAIGKHLVESYSISQTLWIRSIMGMLVIAVYAIMIGQSRQLKTGKPEWHLLRSFLGLVMLLGIFHGLKHLPLAEVIALSFANPFIIALLTPLLLKEKVTRQSWLAIIIGFLGVMIIARPTPDHFHIAYFYMLFFALSVALLIITARQLVVTESVITLNFYLYPFTIVTSTYWALSDWVVPSLTDWLLFAGLAFCATAALACVTQAMHYAKPVVVAPVDYFRLIWTPLVGYIFWHEIPEPYTIAGIIVIVISGIYIVRQNKLIPKLGARQLPVDK